MKAYTQLTLAQLRIFIRNRQVLLWTFLFPVFFMVMFGTFFGGGGSVSLSGVVIDQDSSRQSAALVQALMKTPAMKLVQEEHAAPGMERLKEGDLQMVVIIPPGYGTKLQAAARGGEAAALNVYYDQTNVMTSELGTTVVTQVADGISKEMTGYQPVIAVKAEGVQALKLSYMDFLVPGIVSMMIMSNNLNGVAGQIASWRERGILRRMQSTTLTSSTFIASQITARLLLNGMQAVIVLLIASLIFGTHVNGSWLLLLLFVILGTLAFMSIGFIVASLAKTPESAGPIAGFISFPMLFLGGVFFSADNIPSFLQPIVNAIPITHLSTAMRQVMNVGADLTVLWPQALILGGWMIVAFAIASFTFKWE
ncbi:ABC transporter permease [Paenibacillus lutrae]|uniref:ABC transporter permease n=1 Tax=Paenibacillus lutrae TaxID=2078573 RepID=A0A7X3FFF5_9BACL|nr:ABC transporter permease [Paenibacillus lutrae]MVO98729.1 ABC transporter permease [Paenibacillus lutrae]